MIELLRTVTEVLLAVFAIFIATLFWIGLRPKPKPKPEPGDVWEPFKDLEERTQW